MACMITNGIRVPTDILAGFKRSVKMTEGGLIGIALGNSQNYLDVVCLKGQARSHSHASSQNDLGFILSQLTRQSTAAVGSDHQGLPFSYFPLGVHID